MPFQCPSLVRWQQAGRQGATVSERTTLLRSLARSHRMRAHSRPHMTCVAATFLHLFLRHHHPVTTQNPPPTTSHTSDLIPYPELPPSLTLMTQPALASIPLNPQTGPRHRHAPHHSTPLPPSPHITSITSSRAAAPARLHSHSTTRPTSRPARPQTRPRHNPALCHSTATTSPTCTCTTALATINIPTALATTSTSLDAHHLLLLLSPPSLTMPAMRSPLHSRRLPVRAQGEDGPRGVHSVPVRDAQRVARLVAHHPKAVVTQASIHDGE